MPKLIKYEGKTLKVIDSLYMTEKSLEMVHVGQKGRKDFFEVHADTPTVGNLIAWIGEELKRWELNKEIGFRAKEGLEHLKEKVLPKLNTWMEDDIVDVD